jgi:hypothetical protein
MLCRRKRQRMASTMWVSVRAYSQHNTHSYTTATLQTPYDLVLLGGLTGRLDQTVHTLSYLHKVRKSGRRTFVVTDENVGWVLDEANGFFFFPVFHSPRFTQNTYFYEARSGKTSDLHRSFRFGAHLRVAPRWSGLHRADDDGAQMELEYVKNAPVL